MPLKPLRIKKLRRLFVFVLILGAILWNGWVLGFLNQGLAGYLNFSISELEVVGQPARALFDFFESISGILMIIGSIGLLITLKSRSVFLNLILISVAIVGGLTMYDVGHPLDCNRYNNPICIAKVYAEEISITNIRHNTESRVTAYVTIFLALIILVWAFMEKLPRGEIMSITLLALGIVVTLTILNFNNDIELDAILERIWNVLVSLDIVLVALLIKNSKNRAVRSPAA